MKELTLVPHDTFDALKNKRTRSTIRLYGLLYYAYRHSVGTKMLKASYWPARIGWHTWLLWLTSLCVFTIPFGEFVIPYAWGKWYPIIAGAVILTFYFSLASLAIRRGLSREYLRSGILGKRTKQPIRLIRTLLHHIWFSELARKHIAPTKSEIERVLLLIDSSNGKPAVFAGFSRHPIVIFIIGTIGYALNLRFPIWIPTFSNEGQFFTVLILLITFILYTGFFFYSMQFTGAEDEWRFKRHLNWYLLELEATADHQVGSFRSN